MVLYDNKNIELFENVKNSGSFYECFILGSRYENFPIAAHWHYYAETLLFTEGEGHILLNGEPVIANTGDVLFINSRDIHSISSSCDTTYTVLKFSMEMFNDPFSNVFATKYILPFNKQIPTKHKLFKTGTKINEKLVALITNIYETSDSEPKPYAYEFSIRGDICKLLSVILRSWNENGIDYSINSFLKDIQIQKLEKAFIYLKNHYMNKISAKELASVCNMSFSYFSRQFKKVTEKSVTDYVNYLRVAEAERLLLTEDLSITEVSERAGFSDANYFIKRFKALKSMTPHQFKNKFKGEAVYESDDPKRTGDSGAGD